MKAEIYSKDTCPYCDRAKELLTKLNIPYDEYTISAGMGESVARSNQYFVTRAQLLERLPTAKTVPQIWIDGRHVGGCDNLEAEVKAGKILTQ
jgi:glutaredoxin 3